MEERILKKHTAKTFNTAAVCVPTLHYMADISDKIARIVSELIEPGCYFTINRARQYGKTTLLSRLAEKLQERYYVISISFEGTDDIFTSAQNLVNGFLRLTARELCRTGISPGLLAEWKTPVDAPLELVQLDERITALCGQADKEIILMIDEVDRCAGHELFLTFLGLLRDKYIRRANGKDATFKSVILASVYDVKNLKLKMRPEAGSHYNSPWNVAVDFDIDMNLSPAEIAGMLQDYENEHCLGIDIPWLSRQLYEYTSGYPYLVSRICQLIDRKVQAETDTVRQAACWSPPGFLQAIKQLLITPCTLFDDINKNLDLYPELNQVIRDILLHGASYPYLISDNATQLGVRFGYFKNENGKLAVSNQIFETYLYDMYIMYDMRTKPEHSMAKQGTLEKTDFLRDGFLDMDKVIARFKARYDFLYSEQGWSFTEENGRFLFLTFLKPIINGVGNYYVEARTRDLTRTDVVVDYLGRQYIIELKIYRGKAYQEEGMEQLCRYLDHYGQDKGWLVSFCFHKSREKKTDIRQLQYSDKTIMEAVL